MLGFNAELKRINVSFLIKTFSSKKETTNFGSDLLNPVSGNYLGGSLAFRYKLHGLHKTDSLLISKEGHWFFIDTGIVQNSWKFDENEIQATILAGTIGYEIVPFADIDGDKNQFQFSLKIGPSIRYLSGDIGLAINKDLRTNVLNTSNRIWLGVEITAQIRINTLRGYLRVTSFANQIPGFGKTAIIVGIEALAQLFKI